MKRLLANSILMASGILLSSQLYALGLGELTLDSSLNQPLKASIELTDTAGLTEWEIKPNLASQADFDRAGVERDFFLTGIKFTVENNKIKLTTKDAVNEPFLNFLLELNWPSGRVLREYTVLLDPPTYDEQNYQPLVTAPQIIAEEEIQLSEPQTPALVNSWDEPAASGSYKVQPNDTLWAIALETRPNRNYTPQQMMLAIQAENPDAFIGGNINRLKSHYVLNIPEEERVRAITQQHAIAEVARQNNALNTGVAQVDATGLNRASATKPTSTTGGEVRLVTASSGETDALGAGGDAGALGQGGRQELENDLAIALENVDKNQRENDELRSRLGSLEEQIATLESLISLKDNQLASLQVGNRLETPASETATASEVGAETVATEETDFNYAETEAAEETVNADSEAEQLAKEQEEARKAEERRARVAALMAEQQPEETSLIDELLEDPVIPAAAGAVLLLIIFLALRAIKNRKADKENEFEGATTDVNILSDIEDSAGSLDDFDFEINENEGYEKNDWSDASEDEAEGSDSAAVAQTEDPLSEAEIYIAFGKFGQAQSLLENAIENEPERTDLRLKLLEVFAENDDEKGFYAAEVELNKLSSEQADVEAANLRARLSNPIEAPITPSALGDVEDDFLDLNIDNELADEFSDGLDFADALDLSVNESAETSTLVEESEFDIPTLEDEGADLNFDLELDSELSEPAVSETATFEVKEKIEADNTDSLDFDMDDFSSFSVESQAPTLDIEEPVLEADASDLDFNLDGLESFESETNTKIESDFGELNDLGDLDFELENEPAAEMDVGVDFDADSDSVESGLGNLESILDDNSAENDDIPELSLEIDEVPDFDDADLDFDINAGLDDAVSEIEAVTQTDAEIDLDKLAEADDEFAYLAGTDECATKLDLARAYIDMEDTEGAKELLQEVIQEGSEAQQSEARELISNL